MSEAVPVVQIAAKSLILNTVGQVLILRESSISVHDTNTNSGRYQLSGGRVEPGEAFEDALRRETREETGLEVEPLYPIYQGEWRPVIKGKPHQIIALFVVCRALSSEVVLSPEHDDFQWIEPAQRHQYDIVVPDVEVIDRYTEWQANGLPS